MSSAMRREVAWTKVLGALLLTALLAYMCWEAHADAVWTSRENGFASDFTSTIWDPVRAVRHGLDPYPSPSTSERIPAVYLPPIFLVTLPLAWFPFHVATWVWFACLLAGACGILFVVGVRDLRCYALFAASLPIEQSLVLGNTSIFLGLGVALAWRFRDHPLLGPLALAAAAAVKFWIWPLFVWLLIIRPRAGIRAAVLFGVLTIAAWAVIGFDGLLDYPRLLHAEGERFASEGVLFVPALTQLHVPVNVAAVLGFLGSLALVGLAWTRRASEIEVFTLAILASLVGTTFGWPHYLVLMGLPIAILYPRLSLPWLWFPALWVAAHVGASRGSFAYSLPFCVAALVPLMIVLGSPRSSRMRTIVTSKASGEGRT
jgi:Glycosyltransferase family 87